MTEEHARELLARERARIQRALAELTDRADAGELSHLDQHPADYATDLADRELEAGMAERLRDELGAVERAEQRLAQGVYGRSVESGKPIPDERLELIPWAERTAQEEAAYGRA